MGEPPIRISILIPVRDDPAHLARVLDALTLQDLSQCEVLVCDDGSTPRLRRKDLKGNAELFRLESQGPAAARNHLARQARGEYLLFLDADTLPLSGMLQSIRTILGENQNIPAFFGSYDDEPEDLSIISILKNLAHHHTHQLSGPFVSTFWCGCGVIRRDLFLDMRGFSESYRHPSVEDIELGQRLASKGILVRVFPDLQVKHLKRWTLADWIYTDFFLRGLPWVRLMRSRRVWKGQLNFSWVQRLSAGSAATIVPALLASGFWPWSWLIVFAASVFFLVLNRRFFWLVFRRKGFLLALLAIPFQLLYSFICITALLAGIVFPGPQETSDRSATSDPSEQGAARN